MGCCWSSHSFAALENCQDNKRSVCLSIIFSKLHLLILFQFAKNIVDSVICVLIEGVALSVKIEMDHKVHHLKKEIDHLQTQVDNYKVKCEEQEVPNIIFLYH